MRTRFQLRETVVTVIADPMYIGVAKQAIIDNRRELERYIRSNPFFQVTLEPYPLTKNAPEIVERMSRAGAAVGVGPMAAVAGTIAQLAVEAMMDKGATHAIVDNGGDIALVNDRSVLVGVYAGISAVDNIAFLIEPRDTILGICTSSGSVGHSISFGCADAATVVSKDVSLADAAATALGNAVTGDSISTIEGAFDVLKDVEGIDGALIVKGDHIGRWGELPEIVKADVNPDYITRA